MAKVNCNVIQDILPLYIDDVVSDDTRELVEEHLQNCEICQKVYDETKMDLASELNVHGQTKENNNEGKDLINFKRFFIRRKIRAVLISIVATIAFLVAVITFMNSHVTYISYKDAGITITSNGADEVQYTTKIKGNYHWITSLDSETGIAKIYFEQSLWEKYIDGIFYPFDHIHCILKKDEIKEVYVNPNKTETTIWKATEEEQKAYMSEEHTEPLG